METRNWGEQAGILFYYDDDYYVKASSPPPTLKFLTSHTSARVGGDEGLQNRLVLAREVCEHAAWRMDAEHLWDGGN